MKNTLLFLSFVLLVSGLKAQNIGINTPNPLKTLSVNGTVVVDYTSKNFGTLDSASLVFGVPPSTVGISSNRNLAGNNSRGLDFWTNSLKRLSVIENGNIGIGTTSPLSKLHIIGTADVSLTGNGYLMLGDETGTNLAMDRNEIQARSNGAISTLYLQGSGGIVNIGSSTDENLRISGSHIQSLYNGSAGELILQGINGGKIRLGSAIDFATTKLHISTGVDAGLALNQSGYMMIGPSSGENLIFDNNEILARNNGVASTLFLARDGSRVQLGNGTETPSTKLHISSGTDVGLSAANSGFLMTGLATGSNIAMDNNEIQARNNGVASTLFLQNNGGNVALGNITPTSQLHMTGNITLQNNAPLIQMTNSLGTDMGFLQVDTDDVRIGTNSANNTGSFIVRTNGANRMYVSPTGQFSFGTATPATGYMISVNGKVMAEEVKVQLSQNWPDYVFSTKYKLMNFNELREFIATNNHLPNIPSAKEIEKSGLEIGEMQRRMMEKIEELTLYVLQLEDKINGLKNR